MRNLPTWLAKYIASLSKENLHHAYLFYGREGLGKKDLLTYVSNTILCESTNLVSCGNCKNCKLILSNTHPDLHVILREEGKKNISISQIINLREKIYESAFLGSNKKSFKSQYS